MSQWSINKLKSAKESVEEAKESLSGLGMHSALNKLDYVLNYIDDQLEAEEENEAEK